MTQQFDLFDANGAAPAKGKGSPKRHSPAALSEDDMVRQLHETGRYRILRKLEQRLVITAARPEFPLKGVIIDTETTGLNHRKDEIIEIGAVAFTFDEAGNIGDVIGVYSALQQPSIPIPKEITRLTGITDDMVADQMIDPYDLRAVVEPADLVIAHNAGFDRPFCETFSTIFAGKAWACSVSEIDWASRGFEGTKLGYLIGQAGYFHEGHRAVDDCFALLEVLAEGGGVSGPTPFAELYKASQRSRARIFAENSPYDMKDQLKARGYRWSDGSDGRPRSWWIEVAEDALDDELRYLRTHVYRFDDADPPIKRLTAFDRFRS
ncbi:3'-5' exonuclease [Rhizobium azibense]|uniref:DNA polymerase-3 subunit epsilon n=1 Tax=Rhizobium azibense TaxID=1136135 RepID=A0A4R3S0Z3_9HYPH|nr:3'-5' exonuclease [Rhizobium azibense]TCU37876.1 DNA polymerase-3 subunit epsilon [Rhizobium azibense]